MAISPTLVRSIAAMFVLLNPAASRADCSGSVCADVSITGIYGYGAHAPGFSWIETSGIEALLTSSTTDSGVFLKVEGGTAKADWLFAQLLTGYQTGQILRVRVTGGGGTCRVDDIWMRR